MKWVKVSDKLPQRKESELYSDRVLLFGNYPDGNIILIGRYSDYFENTVWIDDEFGDDVFMMNEIVITHWMPLPEGPEGEK